MNWKNLVSTPFCLLFISLTTAFFSVAAHADSIVVTNPTNGHSYQRIDTNMTWQNAKSHCEGLMAHEGIVAHLATLSTAQESQFVFDNLVAGEGTWEWVWLGGTDETVEGTWEWVTGEPWLYEPWEPGEPNDACDGEDYVAMRPEGAAGCIDTNADASCGNVGGGLRSICEWVPLATPAVFSIEGFIQLDTTDGNAPPDAYCSETAHNGRMVFDDVNDLLYICTATGWISK